MTKKPGDTVDPGLVEEEPEDGGTLQGGNIFELGAEGPPEEGEVSANERSPRRAPRYRQAMKLWDKRESQKLFLRVYRTTGDIGEACRNVDRALRTVYLWGEQDEAFREAWKRVEEAIRVRTDKKLRSLDGMAVAVVEETLKQGKDARLRSEVALKLLKSHGYLGEAEDDPRGRPGGIAIYVNKVEVRRPGLEKPHGGAVIEGEVLKEEEAGV